MGKHYLTLQHSESVVTLAAAQIYAAYITAGVVNSENRAMYMQRSIEEAIKIAETTDDLVVSDGLEPG